ncbi:MAG: hypothetical protein WBG41_14780 [Acidimicrobiales bacterium]
MTDEHHRDPQQFFESSGGVARVLSADLARGTTRGAIGSGSARAVPFRIQMDWS